MKVKMKVIAVTHNFMSLPYGHIFDFEDKMAMELSECGYAEILLTEIGDEATPIEPEPEPEPAKKRRQKRKPSESKGE